MQPLLAALGSDHPTSPAQATDLLTHAGAPADRIAQSLPHPTVERWLLEDDRAAPDAQIASLLTLDLAGNDENPE